MFKKILIFGGGVWLGAYVMYNHLYKKIMNIALEANSPNEEKDTSETKES